MKSAYVELIQQGLAGLGFQPGPIDGLWGARTEGAVRALLASRSGGTPAPKPPAAAAAPAADLPWMAEAKRLLGRHEGRDNGWLSKWLRSDGRTLGDPAKLPWCGDFVETCIRLALPNEAFNGPLAQNPYWARNWTGFGDPHDPAYGAVLVFERGSGGHVGFCMGADDSAYHVLGGNQSNAVTVARIDKSRLIGARWPATYPRPARANLPRLSASGSLSRNEA